MCAESALTYALPASPISCSLAVPLVGNIIRKDGRVRYTFNLTTGDTPVPIGATLKFKAYSNITVLSAACHSDVASTGVQLIPSAGAAGTEIADPAMAARNASWNCDFVVQVGVDHQIAGRISPFLAGLELGNLNTVYYIDPQITGEVLVHTGTRMDTGLVEVDTTGPHVNGEWICGTWYGFPLSLECRILECSVHLCA